MNTINRIAAVFLFSIISFIACSETSDINYLEGEKFEEINPKAKKIVQASFAMLSSELKKQMKLGGVSKAIVACNVKAPEIENKLSKSYDMTIRRTSNKYRNPDNKPDKIDEKVLSHFKSDDEKGPKLIEKDGELRYYFPIKTMGFCLPCHGTIEDHIGEENYALIEKLYPNDKATGYKEGDFRGTWVLELGKN